MLMPSSNVLTEQELESTHLLGNEAKRLMEFKKNYVKQNDQTPCPQCATLVSIQASKCPHCTSEISEHTQKVRQELQKLSAVTEELYALHKSQMELFHAEAGVRPFWDRLRTALNEPKFLQDLRTVLPFLIGLFALVFFLKQNSSGLVFLLGAVGSGSLIYFLFKTWGLKKYVSVDLYGTVLLLGLALLVGSASFDSSTFWPETPLQGASLSSQSVRVQSASANIRQEPTTTSSIVTTARNGDTLTVREKKGPWYKVRTESGSTGWIYSSLVTTP
jgi:hypothetical protein